MCCFLFVCFLHQRPQPQPNKRCHVGCFFNWKNRASGLNRRFGWRKQRRFCDRLKRKSHRIGPREREMRDVVVCLLAAPFLFQLSTATVVLNSISASFTHLPAKFGRSISLSLSLTAYLKILLSFGLIKLFLAEGSVPRNGICGALFVANPLDGCSPLLPPSNSSLTKLALIIRGGCSFEDKLLHAQNSGFFQAVIVYDNLDNEDLVISKPQDITSL